MSGSTRRTIKTAHGERVVQVQPRDGSLRAVIDGEELGFAFQTGAALGAAREVLIDSADGPERALVVRDGDMLYVHLRGATHQFAVAARRARGGAETEDEAELFAESPMTGVVLKMHAVAGAAAAAGSALFVIEAMKMEFVVEAPRDVVIAAVAAGEGDRVDIGQTLVTFASDPVADDDQAGDEAGDQNQKASDG